MRAAIGRAPPHSHAEEHPMLTTPLKTARDASATFRFGVARLETGPLIRYVEQGDTAGEPLILLHGYTDSWYSFSRLLPLLEPGGYHIFAIDQRGHGCSERPFGGYTTDDFAADVDAFMQAVGIRRATLVGHSMGSLVARRVAVRYPHRVSRLVLLGAILGANDATRELQAAVRTLEDPVPSDFVHEFQASTVHVLLPVSFFEGVVAESMKVPARVWRDALDGLFANDDRADLGRIAAPTLLLWGERDAFFSREEQDRLVAGMPNARLLVYPETGHSPQWERPEQVARDLSAFLRPN
jgi:pimeloyl-ACP methyl ester carboxylesterase